MPRFDDTKCDKCGRPEGEGQGWIVRPYGRDLSLKHILHETCPERVCKKLVDHHRGLSMPNHWPCSRDAKEQTPEGEWLCGRHMAAYRKIKATDQAYRDARDGSDANNERAKMALEILAELGIEANVHYYSGHSFGSSGYTGKIVVDPVALFDFLGIGAKLPDIRPFTKEG